MDWLAAGVLVDPSSSAAACRGAQVRVLLDGYFDDAEALRSNQATVEYLNLLAASEGLDIQARTGNPTGGGIHAKVVLIRIGAERWSTVGSLNGGEVSHKVTDNLKLPFSFSGPLP